jgi:dienelactone hydrolase
MKQEVGVALFDFAGHGESTGELGQLSLVRRQKQASDVIDKLLPASSQFYLLGFSMGAQTACDLLPDYGDRIINLLLASPAIYRSDVYELPFETTEFTAKLREPGSWQTSTAPHNLADFKGKTIIAIGSEDQVIPKGVPELLKKSARQSMYKEYAGVGHSLAPWLAEHPTELSELISELLA